MKNKSLLITGVSGFVGRHLAEYLISKGYFVYGFDFKEFKNQPPKNFQLIKINLLDAQKLSQVLKKIRPAGIFHLAGESNVAFSWQNPARTFSNNLMAGLGLLQNLAQLKFKGKIIVILSAEEYGIAGSGDLPFSEESRVNPSNPYGSSKAALDFLALGFYLGYGLKIIRLRPFNHIGPGQAETFVVSDFAKQIARIEAGGQKPEILVGNLAVKRDFLDVRDVVRAYYLAFKKVPAGAVYNLCSGRAVSIGKILKFLLGLAETKIKVKVDSQKFRKTDQPVLLGTAAKFQKTTGWQPKVKLQQSLKDVLNYWRRELKRRASV